MAIRYKYIKKFPPPNFRAFFSSDINFLFADNDKIPNYTNIRTFEMPILTRRLGSMTYFFIHYRLFGQKVTPTVVAAALCPKSLMPRDWLTRVYFCGSSNRAVRRRPLAADCCRIPAAVGEQHTKKQEMQSCGLRGPQAAARTTASPAAEDKYPPQKKAEPEIRLRQTVHPA